MLRFALISDVHVGELDIGFMNAPKIGINMATVQSTLLHVMRIGSMKGLSSHRRRPILAPIHEEIR